MYWFPNETPYSLTPRLTNKTAFEQFIFISLGIYQSQKASMQLGQMCGRNTWGCVQGMKTAEALGDYYLQQRPQTLKSSYLSSYRTVQK